MRLMTNRPPLLLRPHQSSSTTTTGLLLRPLLVCLLLCTSAGVAAASPRRPSWFAGMAAAGHGPAEGALSPRGGVLDRGGGGGGGRGPDGTGEDSSEKRPPSSSRPSWTRTTSSRRQAARSSRGGAAVKAKRTRGGETSAAPGIGPAGGGGGGVLPAATGAGDNNSNNSPATAGNSAYTAVSTVVWGDPSPTGSADSLQFLPGCQLLGDALNWVGLGTWAKADGSNQQNTLMGGNTPALWKTLSFLSDVVVLVLNTRDPIELELVNALEAGFQARQGDLPKGRLLIVLHGGGTLSKQELQEWKARLSSTLEGSAPRIVEELAIVPSTDYASALRRMQQRVARRHDGVCQLADSETFPSLVKQVHRAFGGGNSNLLKPAASSQESLVLSPPSPPSSRGRSGVASAGKKVAAAAAASAAAVPQVDSKKVLEDLIGRANDLLDAIQIAQENVLLDSNKGGRAVHPINFAGKAQSALAKIEKSLRGSETEAVSEVAYQTVATHVKGRVRALYQQQLESLRDYYGKLYESALEKTSRKSWKDAATKTTERFRKAAEQAVPALVRPGKLFEDGDLGYYRSMAESGLISDMMEATNMRQDAVAGEDDEYLDDDDDEASAVGPSPKRAAKWYEKLAARALVVGVNYVQGWLAWQGIKRAALLREQQMPKFPLF